MFFPSLSLILLAMFLKKKNFYYEIKHITLNSTDQSNILMNKVKATILSLSFCFFKSVFFLELNLLGL